MSGEELAELTDRIHELTHQISVFDSMLKNFQEDLSKYKV